MKTLLASLFLSLAVPAAADTPPPVTGTPSSLAALLDGGYEIKAVVPLSSDDQKALYPKDALGAFSVIILQKGASVASCITGMGSIINISPTMLAEANTCHKR